MMHAAILARKSTDRQATSVDRQIADATRFAESRGWTVDASAVFAVDEGVSGAVAYRPQVEALVAAANRRPRLIDVVILQATDRATRESITLQLLVRDLAEAGLQVFTYNDGRELKSDTALDKLLVAIYGYRAEAEREVLVSRTREAAFFRARSGFVAGGRLYAYRNEKRDVGGRTYTVRVVDPEKARWVVLMFERYADGDGLRAIAAALNVLGVPTPRGDGKGSKLWKPSAVRAIVLNETYHGVAVFGRKKKAIRGGLKTVIAGDRVERIELPDLRIVSDELWERVQARFAGNRRPDAKQGAKPTALLIGNLRCATCGGRMYVTGGRDKVYTCGHRHLTGAAHCANATKRSVYRIDAAVVDALLRLVDGPALVEALLARLQPAAEPDTLQLDALTARRADLRHEIENLATAVASATSPAVVARLTGLLDERQTALDGVEAEMAARSAPRPSLDPAALRAAAEAKVVRLADVLRTDIPRGREALRDMLDGQAEAVPITVNGAPRFLIRGRLRAASICGDLKTDGDPNGI